MTLGVFILCGCFNITRVEFTCMATWHPYKTACVSIIDVLIIDSLCCVLIICAGEWWARGYNMSRQLKLS